MSSARNAAWDDGLEPVGLDTTDEPMEVPESFLWSVAVTTSRVSVSDDASSLLLMLLTCWTQGVTATSLSTKGGVLIRAAAAGDKGNASRPICISGAGVTGESELGELEDEGEETEAEEEES